MENSNSTLPSGWEERISRTQGITYYYNSNDGTSSWVWPGPSSDHTPREEFSDQDQDLSVSFTDKVGTPPVTASSKEEACGVGLQFVTRHTGDIEIVRVREGGPAHLKGVCVGDKVVSIDGINSAHTSSGIDVAQLILGPEGSMVSIKIHREIGQGSFSQTLDFDLMRRPFPKYNSRIQAARNLIHSPTLHLALATPDNPTADAAGGRIGVYPAEGASTQEDTGRLGQHQSLIQSQHARHAHKHVRELDLERQGNASKERERRGVGHLTDLQDQGRASGAGVQSIRMNLSLLWCAAVLSCSTAVSALVLATILWIDMPPKLTLSGRS